MPLAQVLLGLLYVTGRGVPRDDQQALILKGPADRDLPLAQYRLGHDNAMGMSLQRDQIKADLWLELAVSSGHVVQF